MKHNFFQYITVAFVPTKVCGQIIIPESVYREIVIQGKGKPGAQEIEKASWITSSS